VCTLIRALAILVVSLFSYNTYAACEISGNVLAVAAEPHSQGFGKTYIYVSPTNSWNNHSYFTTLRVGPAVIIGAAVGRSAHVVGNATSCVTNGFGGDIAWISTQ
ncbi:MAG: hypothetical protein ACREBU_14795, partial [Nitrososphaera sp.]